MKKSKTEFIQNKSWNLVIQLFFDVLNKVKYWHTVLLGNPSERRFFLLNEVLIYQEIIVHQEEQV